MTRRAKTINRQTLRLERQYYRLIRQTFLDWWAELLEEIKRSPLVRLDGPIDFLASLFDSYRDKWGERVNALANQITALGQNLNRITAGYFTEDLTAEDFAINPFASQPELLTQLEAFARDNARLIKNIGTQAANEVERLAIDAFTQGTAPKTLAKQIMGVSDKFGKNRAKLIARDQVSKLSGQLTKARSEAAGIEMYIWQTVGDERVRKSHAALDNSMRLWDQSPTPGIEIQCRCFSVPLIE